MDNEQIEAYLKILDERTRNILEDHEDAARIVRDAKEKLDYFDRNIAEMKNLLVDSEEKGNLDDKREELDKLSVRLDKVEFQVAETLEDIKQTLKLHENLINTARKRLDNQGSSDVKLLKYDKKMKSTMILNIIAVALSFLIPFMIMYMAMNSDKLDWLMNKSEEVISEPAKTDAAIPATPVTTSAGEVNKEQPSKKTSVETVREHKEPKSERKQKSEAKPAKKEEKPVNLRESEVIYTDKEIQQ